MVTNSGYLTNVGLLNAIAEKGIDVFQDKGNHNSIVESSLWRANSLAPTAV